MVGAAVLAASGDLPFGTLASPGAGMLPTLVVGGLMAFGLVLLIGAGGSPRLAEIPWDDLPHALRVLIVAAAAAVAFPRLGFLITMPLLLFALIYIVERRPLLPALAFSVGTTLFAYALLRLLLKTPLPRGPLGF